MKKIERFFALILIPLDFLAIVAAGTAAYYVRFHPFFTSIRAAEFPFDIDRYTDLVLVVAFVWLFVFAIAGLYSFRQRSIASELSRVLLSCSAAMAVIFATLFFSRFFFESRFIAIAAWLLAIVFVCVERLVVRALQRSLLRLGIGQRQVVVIGKPDVSKPLIDFFQEKQRLGFRVVERFSTFDKKTREKILKMRKNGTVDEIILAEPEASREMTLELLAFTDNNQLGFRYSADLFSAAVGRSVIHMFAGIPVIEVKKTPLDGWGAIYKRLFDTLLSLVLIILTLPIQILVATALFIEQPGRVLFSRLPNGKKTMRIGENGKPFHYFKFRSMIKNAHTFRFDPKFIEKYGNQREGTPLFKLEDDPRVTPVGKFIRKLSLDELPEFYLVLLGRMSLVGPRPHLPEEVDAYQPQQKKVHTVKPGITGLSQISGRADLDFDDEVRLDVYYIEHWSPWLDIYILFKTPLVVLFKKGAY